MNYLLKNGKTAVIRPPRIEDAESLIRLFTTAETETSFLGRNPGEFQYTIEEERSIIENVLKSVDSTWFVAEYEGRIVGQCSIGLVRRNQRFRHRADMAIVLLQSHWNLGIGGRMMTECLNWCREHGVLQVELDVVSGNERAMNMYRSFGFEITGTNPRALRYPNGSFSDEYTMVKFLDKSE